MHMRRTMIRVNFSYSAKKLSIATFDFVTSEKKTIYIYLLFSQLVPFKPATQSQW